MAKRQTTQPYLDHDTLDQKQQARHLGVKEETVCNLGHPVPVSRLPDNPVGYPRDYEQGPAARVINERRSVGVYGKFGDPQSGIAQQNNLDRWADYAKSNSYHRGPGPGKDPPQSNDSRQHVPAAGKASDGYLESTKGWAGYDRGADSGEGRLQKARKY